MANDINLAAHIDHPIEHSFADLGNFIGLAIGIVACVAITVFTGGIGGFLLGAGAVGLGGWIGEKLGGLFTDENSGHIARGSPNIFYGPRVMAAARMNDRTACGSPGMSFMETYSPLLAVISPVGSAMTLLSLARGINRMITVHDMEVAGQEVLASDRQAGSHAGSKIADGSISVLLNLWPAARKGDGVFPCDGKISGGIETIIIGGPQGSLRGTDRRSEIDGGQKLVQDGFSLVSKGWGLLFAVVSFAGDRLDLPILKQIGDWGGAITGIIGIVQGNPQGIERVLSIGSAATGVIGASTDAYKAFQGDPNGFVFDERTMTSSPRT